MKRWILAAVVIACSGGTALSVDVPSSARSREAIKRVRPDLEKALVAKGFRWGAPIFVRIFKQSAELELWLEKDGRFELFHTYPICTFSGTLGPKQKEGDQQAPEGFYQVKPRQMNPQSSFHLSFNLGYPNAYDQAHSRTGSALMVHGNCVSIGCYAMTDEGIEPIWALAQAAMNGGQPYFRVHAFPFRMTEENLRQHQDREWSDFWLNLKEGYDWFEREKIPPNTSVVRKRYVFSGP